MPKVPNPFQFRYPKTPQGKIPLRFQSRVHEARWNDIPPLHHHSAYFLDASIPGTPEYNWEHNIGLWNRIRRADILVHRYLHSRSKLWWFCVLSAAAAFIFWRWASTDEIGNLEWSVMHNSPPPTQKQQGSLYDRH